ncbi:MAG TPA: glycerate kinase [Anaerolineae bacterium]|nr:glycerate kinase [Anaerolineae bacterium]
MYSEGAGDREGGYPEPFSIRTSPRRESILAVQRAALAAVEPGAAVRRHFRLEDGRLSACGQVVDLAAVDRIWVIAAGKAAPAMAAAAVDLVGDRLAGGLVVTKAGEAGRAPGAGPLDILEAGHPIPDERGVRAARRLADLLSGLSARDLVLVLMSGGASALTTLPAPGLSLADLQATTSLLLACGATIVELNTLRKHLCLLKGGDLARRAAPARVLAMILSDVVGDPLDVIASGPTAPDTTTFADAWAVGERYGLETRLPGPVRRYLEAGLAGHLADTPKPGDPFFSGVQNCIVGSNRLAAESAVAAASAAGLHSLLLSTFVEGEARQVGRVAAALARELVSADRPARRPACLVWGGETTVTLTGQGKGGRNQELALAAAVAMEGLPGVLLVALATDGTDGPTGAAGAAATGDTVARARALGLEPAAYLHDNNSYPFFESLGDLLMTGPTGTNVNDLLLLFAWP